MEYKELPEQIIRSAINKGPAYIGDLSKGSGQPGQEAREAIRKRIYARMLNKETKLY